MEFRDRIEAGRLLAKELADLPADDVVVLGVTGGGVPVAAVVAEALGAPLDAVVVVKVGVPWQPELAMAAVGEGGAGVVDPVTVRFSGVEPDELAQAQQDARTELERRVAVLRKVRVPRSLAGRTALVVDDGLATGLTARVAVQVARARGTDRVILAVPVGSDESLATLEPLVDKLICPVRPGRFRAVGQWYRDFLPVGDDALVALLRGEEPVAQPKPSGTDPELTVLAGGAELSGALTVPDGATGLIVIAHGSGTSRLSPRNRYLAAVLQGKGLGTFVCDLLTPAEEVHSHRVFDIGLLGDRLAEVVAAVSARPAIEGLPVGLLSAGTGAAAALWAAAEPDSRIGAVVSRAGRPDLAGHRLPRVHASTLLIVGAHDPVVAQLNRHAMSCLRCPTRLVVVPGATHLFVEPGVLTFAADLAADWFTACLAHPVPAAGALAR